ACTQTDTCQIGTCVGSNPVVCSGVNQCRTCDPALGTCSVNQTDGTACNDGNACTQTDTCQIGTCVASNPVVCSGVNQCRTCYPAPGPCPVNKPAGPACIPGNACTQTDTCQIGTCVGSNPVVCSGVNQCRTCDPAAGTCSVNKTDGTACNDSNA